MTTVQAEKPKASKATRTVPHVEIRTVTPEEAGDWLKQNVDNYRIVRAERVGEYAAVMKAGGWILDGSAIVFDTRGHLKQGQHRLLACVTANVPFETVVVWNVEPDADLVMDTNLRRTLSDALRRRGEKAVHELASTIAFWVAYTNDQVGHRKPVSFSESLEMLEAEPELRNAVKISQRVRAKVGGSGSALAVAWMAIHKVDEEGAEEFFGRLADGAGLTTDDPIYRLRERIVADKRGVNAMFREEFLALIIKAYNAWRVGRKVRGLTWRYRQGEAFPRPQANDEGDDE